MTHNLGLGRLSLLAVAITSVTAATASAAHNVCVPEARGVPSRKGPPKWLNWNDPTAAPTYTDLDDPRWLGATGQSFHLGGAREPLLSRALWAHGTDDVGAPKDYLYLSFIVDLEGLAAAGPATPRDLFVGFRRPGAAFAGPGGPEQAYIFQFHLTSGASAPLVRPAHCGVFTSCDEASGTASDFWRVFVDRGATGTCGGVTGEKFDRLVDASVGPGVTWMTTVPPKSPEQDAVRYWKLDADVSHAPLIQNRWAVQLRLPIAPNDTSSLELGIPPGATFWYQATSALSPSPLYANLGWWPRERTAGICPQTAFQDFLVHPELGTAANWSGISRYSGDRPTTGCDVGLTIETPNIGSFSAASGVTNFAVARPTTSFKAVGANTVVAQVVNLGPTDVTAPIMARFRLAQWGSAPWVTDTDHGQWQDIRGAENGVCGTGSPPTCAGPPAPPPFTIPHMVDVDGDGVADDADHDGVPDVINRAAIHFPWTLGTDATLGTSEFCKFGLKPPGAPGTGCAVCSCAAAGAKCDKTTDPGTQATFGSPAPCVSARIAHQCLFVELSAPNGGADFANQSSWNNMNFDQMSVVSREALIDARQLPRRPDQKDQDVYLVVMARNMPGTVPGGTTDGGAYVRELALQRAEKITTPYLVDLDRQPPNDIAAITRRLGRPAGFGDLAAAARTNNNAVSARGDDDKRTRERLQKLARALAIMPDKDVKLVVGLAKVVLSNASPAELNEAVVAEVGADEAAGIVPTLEVYPFYRPLDQGIEYIPMTAFTVFLSHDGSMTGMKWLIDGATRVGQNIYHLRIPVGFARRIQVRAEAIEAAGQLAPPNAKWPCTGGCACGGGGTRSCGLVSMIGNTTPGLIAGVLVVRRRKKKPARDAAR